MGETDGFDRAPNIQSIKDFQASNASEEDTCREACGHGNQSLGWESHFSRVRREPAAGSIGNAIGVDVERDRNSESIGDTQSPSPRTTTASVSPSPSTAVSRARINYTPAQQSTVVAVGKLAF